MLENIVGRGIAANPTNPEEFVSMREHRDRFPTLVGDHKMAHKRGYLITPAPTANGALSPIPTRNLKTSILPCFSPVHNLEARPKRTRLMVAAPVTVQ